MQTIHFYNNLVLKIAFEYLCYFIHKKISYEVEAQEYCSQKKN